MKKKRNLILPLLLSMMATGLIGCSKDNEAEIPNSIISNLVCFSESGCKSLKGDDSSGKSRTEDGNTQRIEYEGMSNGRLFIKHINAVFCCVHEEMRVSSTLQDNEIKIVEQEVGPTANCTCPYDLELTVGNLEEKEYTVLLYNGDSTPFAQFNVSYSQQVRGEITIK